MHDIVLEISFLDINSQNWITGSHLKLMLKSLKIQYIFQKSLCMANRPNKTDFWTPKFFWYLKISFIRPISHAKEILKYVLYFQTFLKELQTAAGNPILRIDV